MRPVQVPAVFNQFRTLKDGSIQFGFESQEMTPEEAAKLFALRNQFGWVLVAPNELDEEALPDMPAPRPEDEKSQAVRVRNAIHIWWEQSDKRVDSETFYRQKMERVLEWVKRKLV